MIGIDSLKKRIRLQSLGMLAVELQGAGGEALQIATGKNTLLKMKIPTSLLANAPANIPLWYLDKQSGLWKQEGVAIKTGTFYTGDVKHFSFWNCDVPSLDLVFLEMVIQDLQGHPLPYTLVEIKTDSSATGWAYPSYGYTDSTGYVGGLVPANQSLLLSIKNECYSDAYTRQIDALSQNTHLGTLNAIVNSYEVNIGGTVKNCTGQAVTNGWRDIFLDNKSYKATINTTGTFALSLLYCSHSLTVIANDITAGKSGNPVQYTIGTDSVNNLVLTACDVPLVMYIVSTLAGSDTGYVDATGTAAKFYFPNDAAVDANGNVIIADLVNNRIRKVTPTGIVTTIAGGNQGFADGTGTATKFYHPSSVAIDPAGNIIVADPGNSRIRKISPSGVVTTIAGNGSFGYADGTGTAAKFNAPQGVTVDAAGNIFVADYNNQRTRKISPAGIVTTVTSDGTPGYADGTGTAAKFNYPNIVAADGNGNIIVGDRNNFRIRKISSTGVVTTIPGDGTQGDADGIGTAAQFATPDGIDIDTSGNIIVADYNNDNIRKISPADVVTTIAGRSPSGDTDGPGLSAKFYGPDGVAVDSNNGNIYITDRNNCRIRKLKPQ